jgi:hypothetical protein
MSAGAETRSLRLVRKDCVGTARDTASKVWFTVPKVIDRIPPSGVSQAVELDPTRGPVVLQGLTVP